MKAWRTTGTAGGLLLATRPAPEPAADEVLIGVEVCGICRTDLHVIDQEIPPHRPTVTPGHQVVGTVTAIGSAVDTVAPGDRVGVAWLRRTCGACAYCRRGAENLCERSEYTGWDADGGFAEVLADAQAKGYAEADPSLDVGGGDTAHKLALLSSLAFGTAPDLHNMKVEGIAHITADDIRFATNPERVRHRDVLVPIVADMVKTRGKREWIAALEAAGVPCGPINDVGEVFGNEQVHARGMRVDVPHPSGATASLVRNPIRMSATPPEVRSAPPTLGEHTDAVLRELLGYDEARIAALRAKSVI